MPRKTTKSAIRTSTMKRTDLVKWAERLETTPTEVLRWVEMAARWKVTFPEFLKLAAREQIRTRPAFKNNEEAFEAGFKKGKEVLNRALEKLPASYEGNPDPLSQAAQAARRVYDAHNLLPTSQVLEWQKEKSPTNEEIRAFMRADRQMGQPLIMQPATPRLEEAMEAGATRGGIVPLKDRSGRIDVSKPNLSSQIPRGMHEHVAVVDDAWEEAGARIGKATVESLLEGARAPGISASQEEWDAYYGAQKEPVRAPSDGPAICPHCKKITKIENGEMQCGCQQHWQERWEDGEDWMRSMEERQLQPDEHVEDWEARSKLGLTMEQWERRIVFERNCSCHICPPCSNCLEYSELFPEEC